MAMDVEYLLMYLSSTCTLSENCLFNSCVHLLTGSFALLVFSFLSSFVYSGY
jgi:hypothetical protein